MLHGQPAVSHKTISRPAPWIGYFSIISPRPINMRNKSLPVISQSLISWTDHQSGVNQHDWPKHWTDASYQNQHTCLVGQTIHPSSKAVAPLAWTRKPYAGYEDSKCHYLRWNCHRQRSTRATTSSFQGCLQKGYKIDEHGHRGFARRRKATAHAGDTMYTEDWSEKKRNGG